MAKEKAWRSVVIISPQIHQFRGFVSTFSAAKREGLSDLKVYNCVGLPMYWCKPTVHSQGSSGLMKDVFMSTEWPKMVHYHDKGDLLTVEEGLEYLNQRDMS